MHLRKFKILIFIIIILIFSSLLVFNIYNKNNSINQDILINEYIDDTSINNKETSTTSNISNTTSKYIKTTTRVKDNFLMILEIPKINIKKGIYNKDFKHNNVDENITILSSSNMPDEDNGNVILASHSGNSNVSYFKNLDELNNGDVVYIYYNGNKYNYVISEYEIVDKIGTITINKAKGSNTLVLITCKKNTNDKQIYYLAYLEGISKY